MAVSRALGGSREVGLEQGVIPYGEAADGPPRVLVHGFLVNGDLWRNVVPPLADRVAETLP
jgi:pimeloyl-ACP methyl ester carboxylesterase